MTVKLNNTAIERLYNACCGLDTPYAKNLAETFDFSPETRLKIARNLRLLRHCRNQYMENRNQLILKYSNGAEKLDHTHPQWLDFGRELAALDLRETDLPLEPLTVAELNLEKNAIPAVVLANLDELLDLNNR